MCGFAARNAMRAASPPAARRAAADGGVSASEPLMEAAAYFRFYGTFQFSGIIAFVISAVSQSCK